MRNIKYGRLLTVVLPVLFSAASITSAAWNIIDIGNGVSAMYGIAIGNVRNDGVNRIYGSNANTHIYEFTYSGNLWNKTDIGTGGGGVTGCLVAGNGRNDGVTRLYGASANAHIYEFSYSGGAWATVDLGNGGNSMNGVALGIGQNDGKIRVYGANSDGHVYEFTFAGGTTWTKADLGLGGVSTGSMNKISLAAGRNDASVRVYAANNDFHMYEFTYSGGSWSNIDMGFGGSLMRDAACGNGRSDGLNRLYGANADGRLYEYAFGSNAWSLFSMDSGSLTNANSWMEGVTIASGRNDGVARVYGADKDTHMYEFTYLADTWTKTDMGSSGGYMQAVAAGSGRNDGVSRIYAANYDFHIYEFSYSTSTSISQNVSNNSLSNAVVYPTFANLSKGDKINFADFTPGADIVIISLPGHVVKTMRADINGSLPAWDGTVDSGGKAASGTYVVHAANNKGEVKLFKILLIK